MNFGEWLKDQMRSEGRCRWWLADQFGVTVDTMSGWMNGVDATRNNYDILCRGMLRIDKELSPERAYEIAYGTEYHVPDTLQALIVQTCFFDGIRRSALAQRLGVTISSIGSYVHGEFPCKYIRPYLAKAFGMSLEAFEALQKEKQ